MSSAAKSELVPLPIWKEPETLTHPGYQPAGSYNRPGMKLPTKLELFVLRHIARHYLSSAATIRPPRFAVIQGAPGDGKDEGVRLACSRSDVDLIMVDASELAGEHENAGPVALARLGEVVRDITAREGRPMAICISDFDLSTATRQDSTQYTVNSQLLIGAFQHLADTGTLGTAQGQTVPLLMTGNDFTLMRSSLLRPGRAVVFEHALDLDETCEIVAGIFGASDPKSVHGLVSAHRKQPIAFFAALRSRALDEKLNVPIAKHGLNIAAIERELNDTANLIDLDQLQKLAAEAAASRARNYLKRR